MGRGKQILHCAQDDKEFFEEELKAKSWRLVAVIRRRRDGDTGNRNEWNDDGHAQER
jgi:hypothetical protein